MKAVAERKTRGRLVGRLVLLALAALLYTAAAWTLADYLAWRGDTARRTQRSAGPWHDDRTTTSVVPAATPVVLQNASDGSPRGLLSAWLERELVLPDPIKTWKESP
jgi:hypothetical protein